MVPTMKAPLLGFRRSTLGLTLRPPRARFSGLEAMTNLGGAVQRWPLLDPKLKRIQNAPGPVVKQHHGWGL